MGIDALMGRDRLSTETPAKKLAIWRERLAQMDREGMAAYPIGLAGQRKPDLLEREAVERIVTALAEEAAIGAAAAVMAHRQRKPCCYANRGRWQVKLWHDGQTVWGGSYATEGEASARVAELRAAWASEAQEEVR